MIKIEFDFCCKTFGRWLLGDKTSFIDVIGIDSIS